MAVLFSNELHACPKCDKREFEEVTIKAYNQLSKDKISVNSATNYIRCVACGNLESVGQFGKLKIEE